MLGGAFATWGNWRGAFYAVTALAALLAVVAARALPRARAEKGGPVRVMPFGRVALICLAIAVMSAASVVSLPLTKLGLFLSAVLLLITMILLDRRSAAPLFPSDAFSPRSVTGTAMTFALLVSIAYSPLSIFVPIFLQGLHGFDPLAAGYTVAGASMGWTVSSLVVAGWSPRGAGRMLVVGPLAMAAGLCGVALLMTTKPVVMLPALISLVGLGIGACWGFGVQRLMGGARRGEGDLAASAVATVQQTGFALGAAAAGIVATLAGLSRGLSPQGLASASFWVPAGFVAVALIAAIAGGRLALLAGRSDGKKQEVPPRKTT
jgi:predicted MFS family arabinose efflux permease